MRVVSTLFLVSILAFGMPSGLQAETKSMGMQASEETLSSVKKMKASLQSESPENSNIVKETVQWDEGSRDDGTRTNSIKMLQGLGICVGLFFIGVAIARRVNPKLRVSNEQRLCVRSRIALTTKTQLILAEVDGREVLVAVGQENVALLPTPAQSVAAKGANAVNGEVCPVVIEGGKEFLCEDQLRHIV